MTKLLGLGIINRLVFMKNWIGAHSDVHDKPTNKDKQFDLQMLCHESMSFLCSSNGILPLKLPTLVCTGPQPPRTAAECLLGHQSLCTARLQWWDHMSIPDQISTRARQSGMVDYLMGPANLFILFIYTFSLHLQEMLKGVDEINIKRDKSQNRNLKALIKSQAET